MIQRLPRCIGVALQRSTARWAR